jgi:hypothetical protein
MTWNYRLIESKVEGGYNIHEVYYDVNGKPNSWTLRPVSVFGETPEEVYRTLRQMMRAVDKPALYIKGDCISEKR